MMVDSKIIALIKSILRKHIPDSNYKIFIFGSRASSTGDKRSDIDIGIEGPKPIDLSILGLIREELEESSDIIYKIDVVDFKSVSSKFYNVAKQHVKVI